MEQDNRLNLVEQENQNQNTLISELRDDVTNLEGIHYTWSPTNRTLTLYDNNGNILSSVTFEVSNINGLQTALNNKQDKLSSFDESILIESDGNIENNVSLFTEYFNTQNCILAFTPIQILGIYKNGLKLLQSEYTITLPKTISINTYTDENIEIQYTHLKN